MKAEANWTATRLRTAAAVLAIALAGATTLHGSDAGGLAVAAQPTALAVPSPLVSVGHPVDWWVVFKFNSGSFPGCGVGVQQSCTFGGTVKTHRPFSQQFAYASSDQHSLQQGSGCAGETATDPLGATFGQVYNGSFNYVIWNDQFYQDPAIHGCGDSCGASWGHSKGMVAWNSMGEGFVLQVTTPSWPAAGSAVLPRKTDGNTLGCINDNDVEVSQHFFALTLARADLVKVLKALGNASVVTDTANPQIVRNGGPADVQRLVGGLGAKSQSKIFTKDMLSSGVELISKPSHLNVPPWQMVSAALDGASLRVATWWANPTIPTTTASTPIKCWDPALGKPGAVDIATTGAWDSTPLGLKGGSGPNFNHAKVGVSTSGSHFYSIFGDMNQQGSLNGPNCASSQNGRGGLFYVVDDRPLFASVTDLIRGESAPIK
jgi:hypothetical protein